MIRENTLEIVKLNYNWFPGEKKKVTFTTTNNTTSIATSTAISTVTYILTGIISISIWPSILTSTMTSTSQSDTNQLILTNISTSMERIYCKW